MDVVNDLVILRLGFRFRLLGSFFVFPRHLFFASGPFGFIRFYLLDGFNHLLVPSLSLLLSLLHSKFKYYY